RLRPLPHPPYDAVILTSARAAADDAGYAAAAERMVELASARPGFLGIESVRGAAGVGITVSYWRTLEDIDGWRKEVEHRLVQQQGRAKWYDRFALRVCKVERAYGFVRQ